MAKQAAAKPSKVAREVRIIGPTVRGTFFISDTDNRIWDGKSWRGFGMALDYRTFKEAFIAARTTQPGDSFASGIAEPGII